MWHEIAIISSIFAVGNLFFGHFVRKDSFGEEGVPKWKRLLKMIIITGIFCTVSFYAGRSWFYISLGTMMLFPLIIHLWWLPKNGINGWTGEPKEKYYELRGWKMKKNKNKH